MTHPQMSHGTKYITALVLTTFVFVIGIFVGGKLSEAKLASIDLSAQKMRVEVLGTELQYQLILESACNITDPVTLTGELYTIGTKLDFMENDLGKRNPQVLSLKEYYSMLEIEHWLLLKKVRKQCDIPYDLILYFYSNLEDCDDCEQQGHVLSYIHKKYPRINIYSFDINIDNPILKTMKTMYGVQGAPSLIVNEQVYSGFLDSDAVEAALGIQT